MRRDAACSVWFFTTEFTEFHGVFSTCHPDDRREEGSVDIHVYASTSALQILRFAQDDKGEDNYGLKEKLCETPCPLW